MPAHEAMRPRYTWETWLPCALADIFAALLNQGEKTPTRHSILSGWGVVSPIEKIEKKAITVQSAEALAKVWKAAGFAVEIIKHGKTTHKT